MSELLLTFQYDIPAFFIKAVHSDMRTVRTCLSCFQPILLFISAI